MQQRVLPALPPALLKKHRPGSLAAHWNAMVVSSMLSDALAVEDWYRAGAFVLKRVHSSKVG